MEAIILAGGKGTRLQSVVNDVPKPMAPVNEHPFLEYLLAYWMDQGIRRFILSIGHMATKVSDFFGDSYRGCPISYSVENAPLGTGGGLLLACQKLSSMQPALVLNGDSILDVNLEEMRRFHQEKKSRFTMALKHIPNNTRYGGVVTDGQGLCLAINSDMKSGETDINGGVYVIDPLFLSSWKIPGEGAMVSLERDMLPTWIARKEPIYGWRTAGRFLDIGTPEDYEKAKELIK